MKELTMTARETRGENAKGRKSLHPANVTKACVSGGLPAGGALATCCVRLLSSPALAARNILCRWSGTQHRSARFQSIAPTLTRLIWNSAVKSKDVAKRWRRRVRAELSALRMRNTRQTFPRSCSALSLVHLPPFNSGPRSFVDSLTHTTYEMTF